MTSPGPEDDRRVLVLLCGKEPPNVEGVLSLFALNFADPSLLGT
jgi:hypothetical protein